MISYSKALFISAFIIIINYSSLLFLLIQQVSTVYGQKYMSVYQQTYNDSLQAISLDSLLLDETLAGNINLFSRIECCWSFSTWIKLYSSPETSTIFRFRSGIPYFFTHGFHNQLFRGNDHLWIYREGTTLNMQLLNTNLEAVTLQLNLTINAFYFLYTGYKCDASFGSIFYYMYNPVNSQILQSLTSLVGYNALLPASNDWDITIGQDYVTFLSGICNCELKFKFYFDSTFDISNNQNLLFQLMDYDQSSLLALCLFGDSVKITSLSTTTPRLTDNTCSLMDTYIECNGTQYFTLSTEINDYYPFGQICLNILFSSLQNGNNQTIIHTKNNAGTSFILIKVLINQQLSTIQYFIDTNINSFLLSQTFTIYLDNWEIVCFTFTNSFDDNSLFSIYHSNTYSAPIKIPIIPNYDASNCITEIGVHTPSQEGFYGRIKTLSIYKNINPINLDATESVCETSIGYQKNYNFVADGPFFIHDTYSCLKCNSLPPSDSFCSSFSPCASTCCYPSCQTCSGPSSSECLSCYSNVLFQSSSGTCDSWVTCSGTNYLNKAINQCSSCDSSCATCQGPTNTDCLTCIPNYTYNASTKSCKLICSDYFFADGVTKSCQICPTNCLTCSDSSTCLTCAIGFWLNSSSQGCQPCQTYCAVCSGPSFSNCTQFSCPGETFLFVESCVGECPSGFYGNTISSTCSACNSKCKTCKGDTANDCLSYFEDNDYTKGNFNEPKNWLVDNFKILLAIISLVIAILSTPFSINNLWILLSSNQFVYLMNFVNVKLPYDLNEFLNNWLFSFIHLALKLPIKIQIPNQQPETKFLLKDMNSFFFANGFVSFLIIMTALVCIGILKVLKPMFSRNIMIYTRKCSIRNFFRSIYLKVYSNLKWSFIIRYILSTYIMMCLYCYLQIQYNNIKSIIEYASYITGWIILISFGIFPIWSMRFLKKHKNQISNLRFITLYGELYSGYRTNNLFETLVWFILFVVDSSICWNYGYSLFKSTVSNYNSKFIIIDDEYLFDNNSTIQRVQHQYQGSSSLFAIIFILCFVNRIFIFGTRFNTGNIFRMDYHILFGFYYVQ